MKTLKVKLTGTTSLVMHSAAMIDPDNVAVLAIGKLQRELKKTAKTSPEAREVIRRQIERIEWEGALYYDPKIGPYIPGQNLNKMIIEGARKSRVGKTAESGIMPISNAPLKPEGFGKLDQAYASGKFALRAPVTIGMARIMKVRPQFEDWSVTFEVLYDEIVMQTNDLKEAIKAAGKLVGICDWRPIHGRFEASFEE